MIREIRYSVSKNGISPAGRQFGGVQGEHKRTRVCFDLPAEIFEEVEALQENGGNGYYRFEVYNGAGEVFRTESKRLTTGDRPDICYTLEERDTRYGGIVHVVLSITGMNDEGTEWEMYTFPAELKLKNLPQGVAGDGKSRIPYSELERKALEASDAALKVKQAYDNGELKGDKGDTGPQGPQGEKGDAGTGIGQSTDGGGEIFNLYEDTTTNLGTVAGIPIGEQTLPKNEASEYAHAEGVSTAATGKGSHAEGAGTKADAEAAHTEGAGTLVTGAGAHAEGRGLNYSIKVTAISGNVITVKSYNPSTLLRPAELEAIGKNTVVWYETDASKHKGEFYYVTAATVQKTLGVVSSCKITLDRTPSFTTTGINLTIIMGAALTPMSHTEGSYCTTVNIEATDLYDSNESTKQRQHAEGSRTLAIGYASHTEGNNTIALGAQAHAEGTDTVAAGLNTHAEGYGTRATDAYSHSEGYYTHAEGYTSHAEGVSTSAIGKGAHSEGDTTEATGDYAHSEGHFNKATGEASHAEGLQSKAQGTASHAECDNTTATGYGSHAEGSYTSATGNYAHSEGTQTTASAHASHAEGDTTEASKSSAHAEGLQSKAQGAAAHAEGFNTKATGDFAHTEGANTKAQEVAAHAEGSSASATGYASHAEGYKTKATDFYAHAEGNGTQAKGESSHAGGEGTIASERAQTALGLFNKENADALVIVGNGTSADKRSNAFEVLKTGKLRGGANTEEADDDLTLVTKGYLKQYVATVVAQALAAAGIPVQEVSEQWHQ